MEDSERMSIRTVNKKDGNRNIFRSFTGVNPNENRAMSSLSSESLMSVAVSAAINDKGIV